MTEKSMKSHITISVDDAVKKYRGVYPFIMFGRYQAQVMVVGSILIVIPYCTLLLLLNSTGHSEVANSLPFGSAFHIRWLVQAGLFAALWFGLDVTLRRLGKAAGIVGLVWGTMMLIAVALLYRRDLFSHIETIGVFFSRTPLRATTDFVAFIVGAFVIIYLLVMMTNGAFNLFRLTQSDRLIMRDASDSTSFFQKSLNRLCGLPPIFAFVPWSKSKYALGLTLAAIASLGTAVAAIFVPEFFAFVPFGHVTAILTNIENFCLKPSEIASAQRDYCIQSVTLDGLFWFGFLVIPLAIAAFCVCLAWGTQLWLRRQLRFSLESFTRIDPRPPVLWLRAFGDDQVPLRASKLSILGRIMDVGRFRSNLDGVLLQEASPYGPVVALGNPNDKNPPYGAARGYFDNKTWQTSVADLSNEALAIVICVDDTNGIWWEVEHLAARQHLEKTLFLIHPRHMTPSANIELIARIASVVGLTEEAMTRPVAKQGEEKHAQIPQAAVIGFFWQSGELRLLRASMFCVFSYLLAVRLFLREKFGLESRPWTALIANDISGTSYRSLAIWSLVCSVCGLPLISGGVAAVLGIVLAFIALKKMQISKNVDGHKIAWTGLLIGAACLLLDLVIMANALWAIL